MRHDLLHLDIPVVIVSCTTKKHTYRQTEVSERWTTCAIHLYCVLRVEGCRSESFSKGGTVQDVHPCVCCTLWGGALALWIRRKGGLGSWEFCSLYLPFALRLPEIRKKHGRSLIEDCLKFHQIEIALLHLVTFYNWRPFSSEERWVKAPNSKVAGCFKCVSYISCSLRLALADLTALTDCVWDQVRRKILAHKRHEVTHNWRKLHSE